MNLRLIFVTVVLLSNASASAFEVIASAPKGASLKDVEAFTKLPQVSNVRPVFSPEERDMLTGSGLQSIAFAKKVSLPSPEAMAEMKSFIAKRGWNVRLEAAEISLPRLVKSEDEHSRSTIGSSFESLQWAIKNFGQKVPIALDDLTSLWVTGKTDEDIGVTRAPKESSDPRRRVTIAVLDTGVDYLHPELEGRLASHESECKAVTELTTCLKEADKLTDAKNKDGAKKKCDAKYRTLDTDGNGYPLDCAGWNVTENSLTASRVWGDAEVTDKIGHGTHVAGIIAARGDDGNGIRGVFENVRILPVKVITAAPAEPVRLKEVSSGGGRDLAALPSTVEPEGSEKEKKGLGDLVARGMLYAIRSKANIINMSLGWPADVDSNLMSQMIELAKSRGILVVAAAGNDGTNALIRPCIFEGVICVASHDPDGAISHFSNHGPGVDIAAPGLNILSLFPILSRYPNQNIFPNKIRPTVFTDRIGYELKSGTSMATPYIAGMLGRLMNAGFSSFEARARLLASASPEIRAGMPATARARVSNPRVQRASDLIVQTGNADLERAFAIRPQPFIMPTNKRPVSALWDRQATRLPIQFTFENAWMDATSVTLSARLIGTATKDVKLTTSTWSTAVWKSGEVKTLNAELAILSPRLESELMVEFDVTSVDAATGTSKTEKRFVAIDIFATTNERDSETETLPIVANAASLELLSNSTLRSIQSVDGREEQDYIVGQREGETVRLWLLAQNGKSYRFNGSAEVKEANGELRALQRIDLNGDGSPDYVFVWRRSPPAGKSTPTFMFRFFDSRLRPLAQKFDGKLTSEAEFNNEAAVIGENFQWVSLGSRRVPAWVTRGNTPPKEKPAYDPWNPNPVEFPDFYLYYWDEDGVGSIKNEEKIPLEFLPATREEMRSGERRVVWMRGQGTDARYEWNVLKDLRLQPSKDLDVGGYRTFRSNMMLPILSTAPLGAPDAGDNAGVGLYSNGYRTTVRVSGIGANQTLVFDKVLKPLSKPDTVNSILGLFGSPGRFGAVSQTIYDMQYEDFQTGEKASTSLRRFSFLPEFYFQKLFKAVVGDDSQDRGHRLPMIYLARGLGTGNSVEVMAPRYENGSLKAFVRPARLRLIPPDGCESMGDSVRASVDSASRIVFACKDRMIFVPLKY